MRTRSRRERWLGQLDRVGSGVVVEPGGEFGGVVPVEEGDGEVVEEFGWELFDSVVFWLPCVVEASV